MSTHQPKQAAKAVSGQRSAVSGQRLD